jgi:hypothetical protein
MKTVYPDSGLHWNTGTSNSEKYNNINLCSFDIKF